MKSFFYKKKILVRDSEQNLYFYGTDQANPLILHLHGGPGQSEYFFYVQRHLAALEKYFTFCYHEQRGAGSSYMSYSQEGILSLEDMIKDVYEVTLYLHSQFPDVPIVLLGHSWGTMLGSYVISRYPDHYIAYIGVGQMNNQYESEKDSREILEHYQFSRELSDNSFKKIPALPHKNASTNEWLSYIVLQRKIAAAYGGILHKADVSDIDKVVRSSSLYTSSSVDEQRVYEDGQASIFAFHHLWPTMLERVLEQELVRQSIPIFICQGRHDCATSFHQAELYFNALVAPHKYFYGYEQSAHFPYTEEKEKFQHMMLSDVYPFIQEYNSDRDKI